MPSDMEYVQLSSRMNQAQGVAQYAIQFCNGQFDVPDQTVVDRTELFHLDSVACAISAIANRANAPTVLRTEAKSYPLHRDKGGVPVFGCEHGVHSEKAIVANCAAVREWDSNGTNFGFNQNRNSKRGEFGHNDFYPVAVAAAQQAAKTGHQLMLGMICLDEIRGRLAEVFGLKDHKIDHVVHGAIASVAVYGAMLGASVEEIESAMGLLVSHYVPFRSIRHGRQLSDSKGASAALSSEMAALCVHRAMRGFQGPRDIFRNRQALFCLFEPPERDNESPFELVLSASGGDFAIMGMHFKIGLYEHQSAGAIHGLMELMEDNPTLLDPAIGIRSIRITIYEPAYSIICDPAKRDPQTRQSADHSMVYIIATLLRKARELQKADWKSLMLMPDDYSEQAIQNPTTRTLMDRITLSHGGLEYDRNYPDGIPTKIEIENDESLIFSSGLVMYPEGHARNTNGRLEELIQFKFDRLASHGVTDIPSLRDRLSNIQQKSAAEIAQIYSFPIMTSDK